MRRLVIAACLLGCSEWRLKPTFPAEAAGRPVINEQAILGLTDAGDAAVAQFVDAEGAPPQLALLFFDRAGGPSRRDRAATEATARSVSEEVRANGRRRVPVLAAALAARWPEAMARARELGYLPRAPAVPEPGRRRWIATGAAGLGSIPLALRLDDSDSHALVLLVSERASESAEEAELARMTLSGAETAPQLFIQGGVIWLLAGSVLEAEPLHRAVGVRRGSLARGEAQLHNLHGLADYAAGDLDAARREFDRAVAADPSFVDGLYNAASSAALSDHAEEAIGLLRRAAALDPARVQVLGRNDEDLKMLRKRADVRALLGLKRPPRDDIPPPP